MRASRGMGKIMTTKAPKGSWIKKAAKRPGKLKAAFGTTAGTPMPATAFGKKVKKAMV